MSLKNYFPPSSHEAKREFDAWLDNIYSRKDLFSYIAHVKSGRYFHTSPSFEGLTGYTAKQFEDDGVDFYMKRAFPEDILEVIAIQAKFFSKALEPDFDRSYPHISEMSGRFHRKDGSLISSVGMGLPLAYLPTGEYDIALCIGYSRSDDRQEEKKMNTEIKALLAHTKILYDRIYSVSKQILGQSDDPVEIVFTKNPQHLLTSKEKK